MTADRGRPRTLLLGVVAFLLVACACTDEGCGNDLRFDLSKVSDWIGSSSFTMEVCADGDCTTIDVEDASAMGVSWIGFPVPPQVGDRADVVVTVESEDPLARKTAAGSVDLESYRPNGRFCAPRCAGADVAIDGSTVLNAEPTAIPPRDASGFQGREPAARGSTPVSGPLP